MDPFPSATAAEDSNPRIQPQHVRSYVLLIAINDQLTNQLTYDPSDLLTVLPYHPPLKEAVQHDEGAIVSIHQILLHQRLCGPLGT